MLEIAFRISEDVIFKISRGACPHNPWRLLPLVLLHSNPPYHKRGSAPGNGRVTSVILMGRRKQQFFGYLKLKSVEKATRKFCELISGVREVLGIAEQI